MDTKLKHSIDADRVLIESLGGPTRLAELLGFPKTGGVQRVQNWKDRGIPASIKIAYPHIFLVGIGNQSEILDKVSGSQQRVA